MDEATFVAWAKARIERRAREAGMDFDPADLVAAHDGGTTTVFLLRAREAVRDEEGGFVEWAYRPLVWAEFRRATVEEVEGTGFWWREYEPRVVVLCPWLVAMRLPDGTVRDGAEGSLELKLSSIMEGPACPPADSAV